MKAAIIYQGMKPIQWLRYTASVFKSGCEATTEMINKKPTWFNPACENAMIFFLLKGIVVVYPAEEFDHGKSVDGWRYGKTVRHP